MINNIIRILHKNNSKKKKPGTIAVVLIAATILTGMQPNIGTATQAAVKFKVSKSRLTIKTGEKKSVKYSAPAKIKLKNTKKRVARASISGNKIVISGQKKGVTKITVMCKRRRAYIKVTVKTAVKKISATKIPQTKASQTPTNSPVKTVKPSPTPTIDPATALSYAKAFSAYSAPGNKFTYDVFNNIKKKDKNTFISPYSIYTALAMLTNGADGNTKTQLFNTLGISNLSDLNTKLGDYMKGGLDPKVTLNVANSLWISKDLTTSPNIDTDFVNPLKQFYNADVVKNFDFNSVDAVKTLNKWVSDRTNGLIKNTFEDTSNLVTTLINTVYFKGRWSCIFTKSAEELFYGTSGAKNVDLMEKNDNYYSYYKDDNFRGISIPYSRGRYSMDVFMSTDETKNTGEVWSSLSNEQQAATIASMDAKSKFTQVNTLKLPKFKLNYDADDNLDKALVKMGLTDMYDETKSDLSKIAPGVFVDRVIHKTAISVDEEGTEAAAVTAIAIATAALIDKDAEAVDFIVNRPFVFCIRDKVSGVILFIGEINNL